VLTRQEKDIAYQYLKDVAENWPKELGVDEGLAGKDVKVVWEGTLAVRQAGRAQDAAVRVGLRQTGRSTASR
jgi:hypothetical protein